MWPDKNVKIHDEVKANIRKFIANLIYNATIKAHQTTKVFKLGRIWLLPL